MTKGEMTLEEAKAKQEAKSYYSIHKNKDRNEMYTESDKATKKFWQIIK